MEKDKNSTRKVWPATNDKEFSKRMFKRFMVAFFIHIVLTLAAEFYLMLSGLAYGQPTTILVSCIPVYSASFLGVITKSGVENVYKGKTDAASVTIGKAVKPTKETVSEG